ncbi:MAG: hypothetical protein ABFC57_03285 [Veillonellales bacterium]
MNKDEIVLDVLRKEYEFTVKSIDDCYKNRYSLYPMTLGALALIATLVIGLYNKQSTDSLMQIVSQNWQIIVAFFALAFTILMYFLLKNRQELTMKTVYKVYLEGQINQVLDKPVLFWDSKVLKMTELAPHYMGIMDLTFLGFSVGLLLSLYAFFDKIPDSILQIVSLVFGGFICWLIYIAFLPKRINRALYFRNKVTISTYQQLYSKETKST